MLNPPQGENKSIPSTSRFKQMKAVSHISIMIHRIWTEFIYQSSYLTLATSRVVHKIVLRSSTVVQLVPAFVVVRCTISCTNRVLIWRTIFVTHTTSFMGAVSLTDSKWWTVHTKAWIKVCKTKQFDLGRLNIKKSAWVTKLHFLPPRLFWLAALHFDFITWLTTSDFRALTLFLNESF